MAPWPRSLLRFLAPALLVLAITVHGARIVAQDASPQAGSAFAMFATMDVAGTRRVVATTAAAGGEPAVALSIPEDLTQQRARLVRAPSEEAAARLAEDLLARRWMIADDTAEVDADGVHLDQVRVAVVGLEREGRVLTRRLITEHEAVAGS
jgi:hypothetical protein